jgi:hypothetical protein
VGTHLVMWPVGYTFEWNFGNKMGSFMCIVGTVTCAFLNIVSSTSISFDIILCKWKQKDSVSSSWYTCYKMKAENKYPSPLIYQ